MTRDVHPEELLGRYPDLVDDRERAVVDAHLAECERCRRLLAHLDRVKQAGGDLGEPPLAVVPTPELRARAEAAIGRSRPGSPGVGADRSGRWLGVAAATLALAAAVAAAILLQPDRVGRPPDPVLDPLIGVKGDDDSAEDLSDVELQLVLRVDDEARLLFDGDPIFVGAEPLVGAVIPEDLPCSVVLEAGGDRRRIWSGRGDPETAAGGALFTGDRPLSARVEGEGEIVFELWLGEDPDAPGARRLHAFRLIASEEDGP